MENVKINDLFGLTSLSQPISNNNIVFFLENTIDEEKNQYLAVIKGYDRSTKQISEYGNGQKDNKAIALSPSGKQLAFLSKGENKKNQIFIQPVQGGSPYQATFLANGVDSFFWRKDGRGFYVQTTLPAEIAKTDAKKPQPIVVNKMQFQQNGTGILPVGNEYGFYSVQIGAKKLNQIHLSKEPFAVNAISNDNAYATFSTSRIPEDEFDFSDGAYVLNLTTNEVYFLNEEIPGGSFFGLHFSEDSQRLLLWGNDNHMPNISQNHLFEFDLATKSLVDLTAPQDVEVGPEMINSDFQQQLSGNIADYVTADYFVYSTLEKGRVNLFQKSRDSETEALISGDCHVTDWSLTPNHQGIVYTLSDLTTPSTLNYLNLITDEVTELYNPNTSYQRHHQLIEAENFHFKGDLDWEIEGWYLKPTNYDTKKKYPGILYVHGGPQVAYGYTFFHEMQLLAAAGYGVIMINPRGSNAYGQDFESAVIKHYGESDYTDLLKGVDAVLKLDHKLDKQQLYVAGGSYGGFMTNWIVTHTDRFKAAVTQRSISNWLSFFGTSDIGYYFTPWELNGTWTGSLADYQSWWEFSPIAHIGQAVTPTLILHGEEDKRCPITQGEEFYMALKNKGVEAKMIRFPQSNHDLSRAGLPNLRVARLQAIIDWFNTHQ